jgi:hypothetical protein
MINCRKFLIAICFLAGFVMSSVAQVNSVMFGKNRVQHKKLKWQYYQSKNFNVYFYEGGEKFAKYVLQSAEKELPSIEAAAENSLQRRANILLYNDFADMKQSNVGLETDLLMSASAVTRFVNNKFLMFYDVNHANLKRQIRQGIADVITKNILFGDDLGEIASNQALLDLPKWFTDGYVAYLGENWSTELDDELKSETLSGNYSKFSKFAANKPLLAGHAFWYFIEEKYKKENVTYFLYLARVYKNLDRASKQISTLSFKKLQREFMEYQIDKYDEDVRKRRAYPKGSYVDGYFINKRENYFRFNVNPQKRNSSFVVTQFKKGQVRLILNDDDGNKTLVKYGVRSYEAEMNPSYPIAAWDPAGTRIAVTYKEQGKIKFFVYDIVNRIKFNKTDLTKEFDQIQDIKYITDSRNLIISGVKNGQSDLFTYDIEKEKIKQVTDDVYDDRDASFVAFPGKTGFIFVSNRPNAIDLGGDTSLPSDNKFNVFLVTNFGDKPSLNQITQLSNLKYGNASYPTPYNNTHFTFVSDENGIGNRYAGFFTTKAEGLDTLAIIGDDILRNPTMEAVDSALKAQGKVDIDSFAIVKVSSDSAYTFPLTNYPSSLAESRVAGDKNQVSEITRDGNEKMIYKLKIDESTLRRRNINAQPTEFNKKLRRESELTTVVAAKVRDSLGVSTTQLADSIKKVDDFFQTEFANEKQDSLKTNVAETDTKPADDFGVTDNSVLATAKKFPYKPKKFSVDFGSASFNNTILINRYQPYGGGAGPIRLNSGSPLNGLIRLGTSDLMEDIKINGGFKIGTNLSDNEWLLNYQNLKRKLDWGLTYYRNSQSGSANINTGGGSFIVLNGKTFSNLYQVNIAWPFDEVKSVRFSTGVRSDRTVLFADPIFYSTAGKANDELNQRFSITRLEFVYDNSLRVEQNIMNGTRGKVSIDWNRQINNNPSQSGPNTFNVGFDVRHYQPIIGNFIWAGRASGDFSFGDQKMIYYLGGVDGWLMFGNNFKKDGSFRYFNEDNKPLQSENYAYQSLAVNMRGFLQNIANGSNAVVINSEFRFPVFQMLLNRTINNAFIRNFQLTQFVDLGTAWSGGFGNIKRPEILYNTPAGVGVPGPITVRVKAGGIGPLAGGYGFGVRSTLFGYYVKFDAAWQMNGIFRGKPQTYIALGLDF